MKTMYTLFVPIVSTNAYLRPSLRLTLADLNQKLTVNYLLYRLSNKLAFEFTVL